MKIKQIEVYKEMKNTIVCVVCGKEKVTKPSLISRGAKFCSYGCYWKYRKQNKYKVWNKGLKGFLSGEKHWTFGKKRPEVSRENNWKWNGGIKTYRKIAVEGGKLDKCESCGKVNKLIIHHKDKNRYNNKLNNLMTVCHKCHCLIHNHFNRWGEYENKNC